jgi:Zn-dependent protease/predicted transcriptional regulator
MGIPVRIHYTLWLVFILIAWSLASSYMPKQYPGLSTLTYWAIGIASAIILFASVLIHELSHSYIAKKNGLPIARITLFFFGGVSEMSEEPQDPGLEVRMAAAGPLMSFLIAGFLGVSWYVATLVKSPVAIVATLGYGALINAILGAFNLVPAFPLDGGRVFRGSVWKHSNNLVGATRTATRVSEGLSLLMMVGGFVLIIFGDLWDGIWFIVLGWFIKSGAETSLRQTLIGETLAGVEVGDIMTKDVVSVPPDITVQQMISDYFLVHRHDAYPVVKDEQVLGILTLQSVRDIPKDRRGTETVGQAMTPSERAIVVQSNLSALGAMQKMAKGRVGSLLVIENGKLLGIVTQGDVMKTAQTRQELGVGSTQTQHAGIGAGQPPSTYAPGQVRYCPQCGAQLAAWTQYCSFCGAKKPN